MRSASGGIIAAVLLGSIALPTPSHATCDNTSPMSGDTVKCIFTPDGAGNPIAINQSINAPGATNVTVEIEDSLSTNDDGDAVLFSTPPVINLGGGANISIRDATVANVNLFGEADGLLSQSLFVAQIDTVQGLADFLVDQGFDATVELDMDGDEFVNIPEEQLQDATLAIIGAFTPANPADPAVIQLGAGAPNLIDLREPDFDQFEGDIVGFGASTVDLADNSETTIEQRRGSISALGQGAFGVRLGNGALVTINAEEGDIIVAGDNARTIDAGADGTTTNLNFQDTALGILGDNGAGILVGPNSILNLDFEETGFVFLDPDDSVTPSFFTSIGDNSPLVDATANGTETNIGFNGANNPTGNILALTTGDNSPIFSEGGQFSVSDIVLEDAVLGTLSENSPIIQIGDGIGDAQNIFDITTLASNGMARTLLGTVGSNSTAIAVNINENNSFSATIENTDIEASGTGSGGISINTGDANDATVVVENSEIVSDSDGVAVQLGGGSVSTINVFDSEIFATGPMARGVFQKGAENSSQTLFVADSLVETTGTAIESVTSRSSNSTSSIFGSQVLVSGMDVPGVNIVGDNGVNSVFSLYIGDDTIIETNGIGSHGVVFDPEARVSDPDALFRVALSVENTAITTRNDRSDGLVLESGFTIDEQLVGRPVGLRFSPAVPIEFNTITNSNIATEGVLSNAFVIGSSVVVRTPDAPLPPNTTQLNNIGAPINEPSSELIADLSQFSATGMGSRAIVNHGTLFGGADGITFPGMSIANIADNGLIEGTGMVAATFNDTGDIFELQPGSTTTGIVDANGGDDLFVLGGEGTATFDRGRIGTQFLDFETFLKEDLSVWTLTNPNDLNWTITGGEFIIANDNRQTGQTQFTVTTGKTRTESATTGKDEIRDTVGILSVAAGTTIQTDADGVNAVEVIDRGIVNLQNGAGIAQIITTGDGANGIFGSGPNGVDITYNAFGMSGIEVQGTGSSGILAEDAGMGDVIVRSNGHITGTGPGTTGIFARSTGTGGVMVDVLGGTVTGGPGMGTGVEFSGIMGNEALLKIAEGATVDGNAGQAIVGGASDDTAEVRGTVVGNVDLLAGDDTFILFPTAMVDGPIDFGADSDILALDGAAQTIGTVSLFDGGNSFVQNLETVEKRGAGAWFFAGDDTPMGAPAVNGRIIDGTAIFQSNLSNLNVTNEVGGRVEGVGGVGNLTNNGVFAPSNQMGTFNVAGDLQLNGPGTLEIDIFADGTSDLIEVAGNTTLGGALAVNAVNFPTGFPTAQDYTVITADDAGDTIDGQFDQVTDNIPDLDVAVTVNAAETNRTDPGSGDPLPDIPANVVVGYDQGEDESDKSVHANSLQAGLVASRFFGNALSNRAKSRSTGTVNGAAGEPLAFTSTDPTPATEAVYRLASSDLDDGIADDPTTFRVWLEGIGALSNVDGTSRAAGYDASSVGLAGGVDVTRETATGALRAGLATGYIFTDLDSRNASSEISSWYIGAHADLIHGAFQLSGLLAFGWQDYDISRIIPVVGGTPLRASSDADGHVFQAGLEASYNIAPHLGLEGANAWRIAPLAALNHVKISRDGYTETGAGILNLTVDDETYHRTWATAGIEVATRFESANGVVLSPSLTIKYEHGIGDDKASVGSTVAGVAGVNFNDVSASLSKHALGVDAVLGMSLTDSFDISVAYSGSLSSNQSSHRGGLSATLKF